MHSELNSMTLNYIDQQVLLWILLSLVLLFFQSLITLFMKHYTTGFPQDFPRYPQREVLSDLADSCGPLLYMYTQRSSNLWVRLLKTCTNWFIMCLRCVKEHDNNWLQHIHWQAERKQVRDTAGHKNDIKKNPGDEREWGGVTGWITALEECGYQVTACQKMVSYCILTHINFCVMHWRSLYSMPFQQCKAILQTHTSNVVLL